MHSDIVAPFQAAASFRRAVSGILDDAATRTATTEEVDIVSTKLVAEAVQPQQSHAGRAASTADSRTYFPVLPFYGYLRKVVIEIPVALHTSFSRPNDDHSSHITSSNDASVMPQLRRLPALLDSWSRQGSGQSFRFGAAVPQTVTAPLVYVQRADAAGIPFDASRDASVDMLNSVDAPRTGSGAAAGRPVGPGSAPLWFGEYVEALTDALLRFFDARAPQANDTTSPALFVEWRRHRVFRDVFIALFYESDEACCFVQTAHRPTQRWLSDRLDELGVRLEWVDGAVMVSSAAPQVTAVSVETERKRPRCVNSCRALMDVVLNANLLTVDAGGADGVNFSTHRRPAEVIAASLSAASKLPSMMDVSITGTYPFRHAVWQTHSLRYVGSDALAVGRSSSSAAGGARPAMLRYVTATSSDGLLAAESTGRPITQSCRGGAHQAPLFGSAIADLCSILIERTGLRHFRLLFECYQTERGGGQVVAERQRTSAAQKTAQAGNALATGGALGIVGSAAGGDVSRDPRLSASGLLASRLSSAAWLTCTERALVVGAARRKKHLLQNFGPEDNDSSADESGDDDLDPEVDFYPSVIEFHRDDGDGENPRSLPCDPMSWGKSFVIRNSFV